MSKPETLKDLLIAGHISRGEIRKIVDNIFDGRTTGAGPDGYVITACKFDELSEHVQKFVTKAILAFKVENVLDLETTEEIDDDVEPVEPEGEASVSSDDAPATKRRRKSRATSRSSELDD